jgi:ketosteroid isomerase-like protein
MRRQASGPFNLSRELPSWASMHMPFAASLRTSSPVRVTRSSSMSPTTSTGRSRARTRWLNTTARSRSSTPTALPRLNRILPGGTQRHVQSVFTDGDRAVVELRLHATAVNGMRYDSRECWVMRFVGEFIVEVRACLDSAPVQTLIDDNHG